VIIETPKDSHHKYAYDAELDIMKLKDTLPSGNVFPYDFGMIPGTVGEDGDPVDAVVLLDFPVEVNCLVECRIIGVIEAWQKENGTTIRNDRILAVAMTTKIYTDIISIRGLNKHLLEQLQNFFAFYNAQKGKQIKTRLSGSAAALKLIRKSQINKK
jgi:inorganic pyrophosphatase